MSLKRGHNDMLERFEIFTDDMKTNYLAEMTAIRIQNTFHVQETSYLMF